MMVFPTVVPFLYFNMYCDGVSATGFPEAASTSHVGRLWLSPISGRLLKVWSFVACCAMPAMRRLDK